MSKRGVHHSSDNNIDDTAVSNQSSDDQRRDDHNRHYRKRYSRSRSRSRERVRDRDKQRDRDLSAEAKYCDSRSRRGSRNGRNRSDRSERSERIERSDRNDRTDRNERSAKTKTPNEQKSHDQTRHTTHTMQIMNEQIKASTGIGVPNYYNLGVVNPIKFAQQEQKRKLLWGRDEANKREEAVEQSKTSKPSFWKNTKFEGDKGNQMTVKFRKLMGIKESASTVSQSDSEVCKKQDNAVESQETLFRNLDMQYTMARMATHTHRGVGLGFGSTSSANSTQTKSLEHN